MNELIIPGNKLGAIHIVLDENMPIGFFEIPKDGERVVRMHPIEAWKIYREANSWLAASV